MDGENFKRLSLAFKELTECPVCFGAMGPDLKQCKNGHGVCGPCTSKIDKCPSCQQEFVIHKSILLGQLLECFPKHCSNADKGCGAIVFNKDHEAFCKFRPSDCRMCDWKGTVADLIDHVKTCNHISNFWKVSLYTKFGGTYTFCLLSNTTQWSTIKFENELFWKNFQWDCTNKRFSHRLYHVATSKPTCIYYLIVTLKKGNVQFTHSCKAIACQEIIDASDDDLDGVFMSDSTLQMLSFTYKYLPEVTNINFTFEIVTEELSEKTN